MASVKTKYNPGPPGPLGPSGRDVGLADMGTEVFDELARLKKGLARAEAAIKDLENKLNISIEGILLRGTNDTKRSLIETLVRSLEPENQKAVFNKLERVVHNKPLVILEPEGENTIYKFNSIEQAQEWLEKFLGFAVPSSELKEAIENETPYKGFLSYYEYEGGK